MGIFNRKLSQRVEISENGILQVGTPRFRSVCAVHEDGIIYVAKGYEFDDDLIIEIDQLRAQGYIYQEYKKSIVPLAKIAEFYGREVYDIDAIDSTGSKRVTGSRKLLNLIEEAARSRASDLKIFVHDDRTVIRAKIAGTAQDFGVPWTPAEGIVALTTAFDARDEGGGHTTMQTMSLQSFSISHKPNFPLPSNVVSLRGQKGYHATDNGLNQHIILRIFYRDDDPTAGDLNDLGFDDEIYEKLTRERKSDKGCVIVGGSTGDGKSTTLIRLIDKVVEEREGQIDVVTAEDPVEYRSKHDSVLQIPVKSSGDGKEREEAYRTALMHAMRISPDICGVSEIRDGHGAKQVLQFVASGHKVYTTIHVDSANKILFRLIEMGVPAAQLSGSGDISMLMKQSLVPILCDGCKLPLSSSNFDTSQLERYGIESMNNLFMRNLEGCSSCLRNYDSSSGSKAWAGYARLIAVGEVISPDEQYMRLVGAQDETGARNYWLKPKHEGGMGGTTLSDKFKKLVVEGNVEFKDAARIGMKEKKG